MPSPNSFNTQQEFVLLFTGHLLDSADRPEQRFPHQLITEAHSLISTALDEILKIQPITVAVSSLGAGGDMIFAAEILARKIPLIIFLPFEKEKFIAASVSYLKGMPDEDPEVWRKEFDRILSSAKEIKFVQAGTMSQSQAYVHCNNDMLDFSLLRGGSSRKVVALALIKPGEDKIEGGTAHFVEDIKAKGIPVQILWPGKELATLEDIEHIKIFIPVFETLDKEATKYQTRWKKRLKLSLVLLGTIAFFDAFVTVPDHFLMGNGQIVRMVSLIFSAMGAFITIQLQLSDKTSLSQWTRSRAKAEQIRSEIWYYLFNYWTENNRSGPYSEGEFEMYVRNISPTGWSGPVFKLGKLISLKEKVQPLSVADRINYYLKYRLDDQLYYFQNKQKHFNRRLKKYKFATLLFLCISITWGALKMAAEFYQGLSFFMDMSPLGMMISFIALVSSYSEANNSKEMEYKYQQMNEGMVQLKKRSTMITEHQQFDEWVKDCETFLRTQNNEWSLKREEK